MLKTSAFESLCGGQFTSSTQLIKPNYLVILPPTQHHSFFRNLPPLFLSTCILAYKTFNKSSYIPSLFHDSLTIVSSLHKYNTRYASKGNFHQPKVRTNTGKFTFVYAASKLWETVPTNLKRFSINDFKKRYKNHLLKCLS